jgi:hypothetical protein
MLEGPRFCNSRTFQPVYEELESLKPNNSDEPYKTMIMNYRLPQKGKVTFRTTFSFRTPVAVVCYDLRTEENGQGVRKGVRNGKYMVFGIKRVQEIVRNSNNHLLVVEQ